MRAGENHRRMMICLQANYFGMFRFAVTTCQFGPVDPGHSVPRLHQSQALMALASDYIDFHLERLAELEEDLERPTDIGRTPSSWLRG